MKKSKYDPKVEHDIVVAMIFNILDENRNDIDNVKTKKQRPTYSRGDKPDITLYPIISENVDVLDPDEIKKAETIIEVENEDSINEKSVEKWKDFQEITNTFYLVVHENCKDLVTDLCLDHNIFAVICVYPINEDGTIGNVNFENYDLGNIIELFILFIVILIFYVIYDYTLKKKRIKNLYFHFKYKKINQLPLKETANRYKWINRYEIYISNFTGVSLNDITILLKFSNRSQILKINTKCKQGNNIFNTKNIKINSIKIEVESINFKESIKLYVDVADSLSSDFEIISCTSGVDFIQKEIKKRNETHKIWKIIKKAKSIFRVSEKNKPIIIGGVFVIIAAFIPIVYDITKNDSNKVNKENISDSTVVVRTIEVPLVED